MYCGLRSLNLPSVSMGTQSSNSYSSSYIRLYFQNYMISFVMKSQVTVDQAMISVLEKLQFLGTDRLSYSFYLHFQYYYLKILAANSCLYYLYCYSVVISFGFTIDAGPNVGEIGQSYSSFQSTSTLSFCSWKFSLNSQQNSINVFYIFFQVIRSLIFSQQLIYIPKDGFFSVASIATSNFNSSSIDLERVSSILCLSCGNTSPCLNLIMITISCRKDCQYLMKLQSVLFQRIRNSDINAIISQSCGMVNLQRYCLGCTIISSIFWSQASFLLQIQITLANLSIGRSRFCPIRKSDLKIYCSAWKTYSSSQYSWWLLELSLSLSLSLQRDLERERDRDRDRNGLYYKFIKILLYPLESQKCNISSNQYHALIDSQRTFSLPQNAVNLDDFSLRGNMIDLLLLISLSALTFELSSLMWHYSFKSLSSLFNLQIQSMYVCANSSILLYCRSLSLCNCSFDYLKEVISSFCDQIIPSNPCFSFQKL